MGAKGLDYSSVNQTKQPRQRGMMMEENTKSIPITTGQVWSAYQEVRKHGKSAGVDELTMEEYGQDKSRQLYKVWNRMASGSYFPPAVRRAEIPKADGKKRKLGIPTISDRVAQTVVKNYLEPLLEPHFHKNSFGYRPDRNAHQAVQQAAEQSWKKAWVLDLDIEGFFDNLDHGLVMRALQKHTSEKWVLMYVERWLKAPIEHEDGKLEYPEKGSPQGGVVSPLLSNLYLHYAFDKWMDIHYGGVVFERYADDIVVHCESKQEAENLQIAIAERLKECGLRLHPDKTKIVYCKTSNRGEEHDHVSYDFLGFTFKPKAAKNLKTGKLFTGYGPAKIGGKSTKKILDTIRSKYLHRRVTAELPHLSRELEAHVRGWINYFGKINMRSLQTVMRYLNGRLVEWAVKRYKRFHRSTWQARQWLREVCRDYPNLFVHWQYGFVP
jgi:RNA-directed DNA polymerase